MTTQKKIEQWFGAYDSKGKLRAMLESESEAYFYIRNRGHVNGGSYRPIPDSWHIEAVDAIAQRDAAVAALRKALVKLDVRVQNASGGDSITEAENIICAAIAAAEKGQ